MFSRLLKSYQNVPLCKVVVGSNSSVIGINLLLNSPLSSGVQKHGLEYIERCFV